MKARRVCLFGTPVALLLAIGCGSASKTPGATGSTGSGAGATSSTTGAGGASTSGPTTTGATNGASTGSGATTGGTGGSADAGVSNPGAPRFLVITNSCSFAVWADALPTTTLPGGVPIELLPGQTFTAGVDNGWSGRVWGRFECTTDATGKLKCQDDPFPSTLSELTLTKNPGTGLDFYDVSLVDGFDLPMSLTPIGHTANPAHPYSCGAPTCSMDLRPTCGMPFRDVDANGATIACSNDACKVIGMNKPTDPSCVYPNQYTEFFKTSCPQAYSYPSDDKTSTFTCMGKDYHVVFCP